MRFLPLLALAFLPAIAGLAEVQRPARAQSSDTQPAFVYGINAAVPDSYVGTFAPGSDAIYLLADEVSIISPRQTEISFWPITNEYRANWHSRNDPVPGTLEVLRNGGIVAERTATDYTIHFTQQEGETSAELFLGQAALDAEASFRARQQAFQEAAVAYQRAEREWLNAAAEANSRQEAGESVSLPPAPERPDPIGVFSNGLNTGIPIDLEAGEYQIRLRGPNGTIVPGSERALTVFGARRTSVGYTVVPETRWTTPLESPAASDVIFGEAGGALYLEPHMAREYPARAWALLQNPQRLGGTVGGWEWVNGERLTGAKLEVLVGGRMIEQRELTPYQVKQLPGSQLGYEVLEYVADAEGAPPAPDFEAYPIHLDAVREQYQVRLISEQGQVMPGSERQVSVAEDIPLTRLLLLPLAPLAVGAVVNRRWPRRGNVARELAG